MYAELRDAAPAVSLESIAARDPDVILVLAADAPSAQQWIEHWQSLPALRAVKNKRVISFIDARLSRMGPEVVNATAALCTSLSAGSLRTRRPRRATLVFHPSPCDPDRPRPTLDGRSGLSPYCPDMRTSAQSAATIGGGPAPAAEWALGYFDHSLIFPEHQTHLRNSAGMGLFLDVSY